jgi:zinc protease
MRPLSVLLLLACLANAQKVDVKKHTLANGMTVLIHEDHDIPNVALYFFFKVGSRNEVPGITGLSHFFEHMMFNGAKKYGPKQFDIQMENNGGRNNGYTTHDVTVYTDFFAKSALDLMFDMEADRIRDLAFDPKMIESERGVVYSERRTSRDNNPFGALIEQLEATAFIAHPYQWSVIGWPSDIEGWTMSDLKSYWSMGYAPNNCVMVIAGDVTETEALTLSRKYLEPIPRRDPPPPVRTKEPPQKGQRRVVIERPAQLPIIMIGFHTPESRHVDRPAIELADAILSAGRSSRLEARLIEKDQLAISVNSDASDYIDPGLWAFTLQPRAGVDPHKAEAAVFEELDRVAKDGISADELEKAKTQFLTSFYRRMKTIAGKANFLGTFEVFQGDAGKVSDYPVRINAVSAADVQRVVRQYLTRANSTVATLMPEKKEASTR